MNPKIGMFGLALIFVLLLALTAGPMVSAAVLFSDDFEDNNSTGWSTNGGSWSVATDGTRVYKQTSTSTTAHAYTGNSAWTNYSIQARAKALSLGSNGYFGLLVRFQSSSNYYALTLGNSGKVELRKKIGGSTTILASKAYSVTAGTWYTMKLVVNGTALQGYVNGALELSAADSSLASGKAGVFTYNTSAVFDDIFIEELNGGTATPTPAVSNTPTPTPATTPTPTPTPSTATPTPTPVPATPTPTLPPATPTPTPSGPVPTGTVINLYPQSGIDNSIPIGNAIRNALPGATIILNAGTYSCKTVIELDPATGAHSGNASAPIRIIANGRVDLDFSGQQELYGSNGDLKKDYRGIVIRPYVDYLYFKGLDIHHAGDNGVKCEGSYNTFEQCVFRENGDTGLQIGLNKDTLTSNPDPYAIAAYNKVINCDAYLNYDTQASGGNADGFACKMYAGERNYFFGCRAWENSDDGWDFYLGNADITLESCWTWQNGKDSGNGNGFKLGSGKEAAESRGIRTVLRCIAVANKKKGFDQNNCTRPLFLYNNTGWNNGEKDYYFKESSAVSGMPSVFRNNVIIPTGDDVYPSALGDNNSWNLTTVTVTSADFASVDLALAKAARQSDGSLPNNGFGQLVSGSDLIDKGLIVPGIRYSGSAPDLGASETGLGNGNYAYPGTP